MEFFFLMGKVIIKHQMWGVNGFQTKPYKPKRCPKGIDGWRPHQTGGLSNKNWPSDDHMALRALKTGGLTDRANEPFGSALL